MLKKVRDAAHAMRSPSQRKRAVLVAGASLGLAALTAIWVMLPSAGCGSSYCAGCELNFGCEASDAGACPTANGVCALVATCRCANNESCNDAGSKTCIGLDETQCSANAFCMWKYSCVGTSICDLGEDDCNKSPNCTWLSYMPGKCPPQGD
jgi:hypothetical protein